MFGRGAHAAPRLACRQPVDGGAPEGADRAAVTTGALAEQRLTPESLPRHVENSTGTEGSGNDHWIAVGGGEQHR